MKKQIMNKLFKAVALSLAVGTVLIGNCTPAKAAPKEMPDGTVFDAEYYAQRYSDVTAVYGTEEDALFQHYIDYGKSENREGVKAPSTSTFDPVYYAQQNPDVVAIYGSGSNNLYQHYLIYGKAEGRKATATDTNTVKDVSTKSALATEDATASVPEETPAPVDNSVTLEEAKGLVAVLMSELVSTMPNEILEFFDANKDFTFDSQELLEMFYWTVDNYTTTKRKPLTDAENIAVANDIKFNGGVKIPSTLYYVK